VGFHGGSAVTSHPCHQGSILGTCMVCGKVRRGISPCSPVFPHINDASDKTNERRFMTNGHNDVEAQNMTNI